MPVCIARAAQERQERPEGGKIHAIRQTGRTRDRAPPTGIRTGLGVVVALLLAFEVTVRHLPPDGVTVTKTHQIWVVGSAPSPEKNQPRNFTVTTSATHLAASRALWRARIQRLNTDLNSGVVRPFAPLLYYRGCELPDGYTDYQVTFTWHGLPVQTWTSLDGCPTFRENSGGIPNVLWTHDLSPPGPDSRSCRSVPQAP